MPGVNILLDWEERIKTSLSELKDKIVDAKILTDVYGSDHCPVELDVEV